MSLINQGFPQPLVAPVALAVAQASARPITGALGTGAAPDTYAANSFSPDYVADFSAASADYFRVAGATSDFETAFTSDSEGGGLATQVDSTGNLVWRAHNLIPGSGELGTQGSASTYWTNHVNRLTETTGQSDPAGGTDAVNLEANTTSEAGIEPASSVTVDGTLASAGYVVQDVNNGWCAVLVWDESGNGVRQWFNLSTGAAASNTPFGSGFSVSSNGVVDLGGGWYYVEVTAVIVAGSVNSRLIVSSGDGNVASIAGQSINAFVGSVYRSDLGGMADVPADQRALSSLTKYVPTTTAARYLLRRRHHYWTGSEWAPTLLHEPVGVTNECNQSRLFDGTGDWVVNAGLLNTKNAVGIDGVANSATTIEDNSAVAYEFLDLASTVTSDTARRGFSCYFKKTTSATTYPALGLEYGGPTVRGVTIDTDNGTLTDRATLGPDASYIEDAGDFWRVSIFQDNNSKTAFTIYIYAAVNSDGSGTWTPTAGSAVIDQVDLYLAAGTSLPSSPIITNGTAVTRTADTCKGKAASLPYSSTAISMAVAGRYSPGADWQQTRFLTWYQDSSNRLILYANNSDFSAAFIETGGTLEQATSTAVSTGINVAVNAAGRYVGSGEIQVALDGTSGTAETATTPAIPPLSDNNLFVSEEDGISKVNGHVDTIRLWDEDIATAGIEQATS